MVQTQITIQAKDKRTRNFNEVCLGYSKRVALEEARRCPQCPQPACRAGCPLNIDIPLFIRLIREGEYASAYNKIKEQNPFAGICGRVCSAPCEKACILHQEGAGIGIRALERFAHDHGRKKFVSAKNNPPRKAKKIAIIGSGPAGFTAALQLAGDFEVAIFEALPYVGGVLLYGVPEFRLPRKILDSEIHELTASNVDFRTNVLLGPGLEVEELFKKGYAAVILCPGAGSTLGHALPGTYACGVLYAHELLMALNVLGAGYFNSEYKKKIGSRVVVLGHSYPGLDTARILRRLAKEVTIVFAGIEEDFQVYPQEMAHAQEEGVIFKPTTEPVEVLSDDNDSVVGVKCLALDFADPDASGAWRLVTVPESDFVQEADTVIIESGLRGKDSLKKIMPHLKTQDDGSIWIHKATMMSSVKHVFAAGDAIQKSVTLAESIASGKEVAQCVRQHLGAEKY